MQTQMASPLYFTDFKIWGPWKIRTKPGDWSAQPNYICLHTKILTEVPENPFIPTHLIVKKKNEDEATSLCHPQYDFRPVPGSRLSSALKNGPQTIEIHSIESRFLFPFPLHTAAGAEVQVWFITDRRLGVIWTRLQGLSHFFILHFNWNKNIIWKTLPSTCFLCLQWKGTHTINRWSLFNLIKADFNQT